MNIHQYEHIKSIYIPAQNLTDSCVAVLVTAFKDTILAGIKRTRVGVGT